MATVNSKKPFSKSTLTSRNYVAVKMQIAVPLEPPVERSLFKLRPKDEEDTLKYVQRVDKTISAASPRKETEVSIQNSNDGLHSWISNKFESFSSDTPEIATTNVGWQKNIKERLDRHVRDNTRRLHPSESGVDMSP